ncbi:MAG: LemA family protein [Simplicispira sp.]|uniref:LemA family protein n=1 Tax=Simplicispira sp. TaxID=2015802 RepID=UPI0025856178|nr:LemA family protein [Simplicispira sp.]MDD2692997.1 LemA family protein [Simplicispira sp.]
MLSSSIFWTVLAILLFWSVGAYNRVVRLRSAALQAFGALDAHWVRMLALLGECDVAQDSAGLAVTPAHQALQAATTGFGATLAVARARPLQADAAAALVSAHEALELAWQGWVAQAQGTQERSPWESRWAQHGQQNALARQQFNDAVANYNAAIAQFPAQVLAWLFGFQPAKAL